MSSNTKKYGFSDVLRQRFREARVPQAAGSLTFTTLLALVPLLTVMLVVVAAFPVFGDISNQFMGFVNRILVPDGASMIASYLNEFKNQAGGLTAAGLAVMTLGALMLMQTIENTFDNIWHVRRKRSLTVRFSIYWALLTLVPILVGAGISASAHLTAWLPAFSGSLKIGWTLLFDIFLLFFLYCFVPNVRVPVPHALIGAVLAALLLESAKWGFNLYVARFNSYHVIYGAFAAIPLFLIWLHLVWMIVLGGAVLTAALTGHRNGGYRLQGGKQAGFDAAVQILMLLKSAQMDGKSLSGKDFQKRLGLDGEELDKLLAQLAKLDYIAAGNNSWLLKTAPEQIILKDLFAQLVYEPALEGGDVPRALRQLVTPGLETLDISLAQFERRLVETEPFAVDGETANSDAPQTSADSVFTLPKN